MENRDAKQAKVIAEKVYTQKKFGENLLALMNAKGITQKELAQAVGITSASLSAYKSGTKSPTLPVAAVIAKELGVSLDWLCDMNSSNEPKPENITYSDVIQALVNLGNLTNISIENAAIYRDEYNENTVCIYLENSVLKHFLEEWKQVKSLLDSGTITRSLYEPWIAQQLRDYDCTMDEVPYKLEEDDDILPF